MRVLIYIVIALSTFKIVWNLAVPYRLVIRGKQSREDDPTGISLNPLIDVVLYLIALLLGYLDDWVYTMQFAIWGLLAICISYVHIFIGGVIATGIYRLIEIYKRDDSQLDD